jgi:hypothetical protein
MTIIIYILNGKIEPLNISLYILLSEGQPLVEVEAMPPSIEKSLTSRKVNDSIYSSILTLIITI